MITDMTKEAAVARLEAAGYDVECLPGRVVVKGDGWTATYGDGGQDFNDYEGPVPPEVDDLAVWDDATTRAE